ncbi:hypothetical protein [Ureibacillus sp. GCM10028918]|uniref:hypothetical protein n=1 Tax=Ureibacillus sp. GCM10028918 TaxID=3273429 RepID=UPI00361F3B77
MLEIQFNPHENKMSVFNYSNEDYGRVTIRHFKKNDKEKGGFGCRFLPEKGRIQCRGKSISQGLDEVDTLAVTSKGILLQHFSSLDEEGKFTKSKNKIISKREIAEFVFKDLYSLHSPNSSLLKQEEILGEFVALIFAFIDKEYRESEEKWNYGQYLFGKRGVEFEQSEGTEILLAKCVVLIDFLNLSKEEMADYLLEFIS